MSKERLEGIKENLIMVYEQSEEIIHLQEEYIDILEEQNKRYREALEKISRGKITYADSFGMINIARKALEESE